jgi:hypothetical protein
LEIESAVEYVASEVLIRPPFAAPLIQPVYLQMRMSSIHAPGDVVDIFAPGVAGHLAHPAGVCVIPCERLVITPTGELA